MALRKDDPVYYKAQLKKLLQQAKNNGLKIIEEGGRVGFIYDIEVSNVIHREQASVNIKDYE
ncbi:hypothetical protein RSJ21_00105 (plasmid) [Clostridium botulinum]|uniref:hypothetical protein n=1 Tax=Clostridium botulinum TaxID=1491 RepID=UPI000C75BE7B|nr:hypothetical protein [Clostridium botulinum]AUN23742.1 hypothetical protein RSJ21_00105 [Clostridium botulinum]